MAAHHDPDIEPSRYATPPEAHSLARRTLVAIALFAVLLIAFTWAANSLGMDGGIIRLIFEMAIWVGTGIAVLREPEAETDNFEDAMAHAGERGGATFGIIAGGLVLLAIIYAYYPE